MRHLLVTSKWNRISEPVPTEHLKQIKHQTENYEADLTKRWREDRD